MVAPPLIRILVGGSAPALGRPSGAVRPADPARRGKRGPDGPDRRAALVLKPSPMADPTPVLDEAHPVPGSPATLAEVYDRARGLSRWSLYSVEAPVAQAVREYLEGLRTGLADEADEAGWRVDEPPVTMTAPWLEEGPPSDPITPYLLVPALSSASRDDRIAVRAVLLENLGPGYPFRFGPASKPHHDAASRVEAAPGGPALSDVPTPFVPGAFDEEFVWVSRDPVDVLLLRGVGVNAVSLAAPCETLGSEDGLRGLETVGALNTQRAPGGTIVVVDPGAALSDDWGALLRGLYDEVWVVQSLEGPADSRVTGPGAVEIARGCNNLGYDSGPAARTLLLDRITRVGHRRDDRPVRLPPPPGEFDVWPGGDRKKALVLVPAKELATRGDTTPWLVKPFVAAGAVTDFQGPAKEGKTTFLISLAASVAQGTTFLGRECEKSSVVYVSEQTAGTVRKSAERASGLVDDVHFLTLESLFGWQFRDIVRFVRRECQRLGARLVVFDTLGPIAGLWGESENASGTAREVYRTLRALSADGVAVVVVRHSRKARGSIVETGAGSVAFSGEADQLVRFTKPSEGSPLRKVEIVGRLSDAKTLTVRLRKRGWRRVKDKGDGAAPTGKAKRPLAVDYVRRVLAHVGAKGATPAEIAELSASVGGRVEPLSVKTVGNELRKLVRSGEAARDMTQTAEQAKHWLTPDGHAAPPTGPSSSGLTLIHSPSPP